MSHFSININGIYPVVESPTRWIEHAYSTEKCGLVELPYNLRHGFTSPALPTEHLIWDAMLGEHDDSAARVTEHKQKHDDQRTFRG